MAKESKENRFALLGWKTQYFCDSSVAAYGISWWDISERIHDMLFVKKGSRWEKESLGKISLLWFLAITTDPVQCGYELAAYPRMHREGDASPSQGKSSPSPVIFIC